MQRRSLCGVIGATAIGAALASCATSYAPKLEGARTAQVEIRPGRINGSKGARSAFGRFWVQVYDFKEGCPDIKADELSPGFRGGVAVQLDASKSFVIPADQPIVLVPVWGSCQAPVTFVPASGASYRLTYVAPTWENMKCSVSAQRLPSEQSGPAATPPERVMYPEPYATRRIFERAGFCAVAQDPTPPDRSHAGWSPVEERRD
jgi:hypothetical protein